MQEPARILSAVQRDSLESAFSCFKGITAFLQSLENYLQADERLTAGNLRDLAGVCEHKLVEAFPDLLEWAIEQLPSSATGERGGA
jgi:hypothetical protein